MLFTSIGVRVIVQELDETNEEVFNTICGLNNSELRNEYDTYFTTNYRRDVSFSEFKDVYTENDT